MGITETRYDLEQQGTRNMEMYKDKDTNTDTNTRSDRSCSQELTSRGQIVMAAMKDREGKGRRLGESGILAGSHLRNVNG